MRLRPATSADAEAIATIHAASWRSTYRGALSDEYLAGDVAADRIAVWTKRLGHPAQNQYVVVAESPETPGHIAGFGCAYAREHPEWGSLLDNLHVAQDLQGQGLGVLLLRDVAAWCAAVAPDSPLYLWVLENNVRAQAFYLKLGAVDVGHDFWASPDRRDIPSYRFAWERPSLLLEIGGRCRTEVNWHRTGLPEARMHEIIWTDYLRYRADLRGFDLAIIEHIVRFSEERYFDSMTERMVAVGRYREDLIMVPYEGDHEKVTPVTVHVTTRQQISLRLRTGRFQP